MFSNIEKLQKKPEHIKRRIALLITLTFFLIITALWFSMGDIKPPRQSESTPSSDTISPFENLIDAFVDIKDDTTKKLDTIKQQYPFNLNISE